MIVLGWRIVDPRDVTEKRRTIAIRVDGKIFGGDVETKHTWSVFLHPNHLDKEFIGPNDAWPRGWCWSPVPTWTRKKEDEEPV